MFAFLFDVYVTSLASSRPRGERDCDRGHSHHFVPYRMCKYMQAYSGALVGHIRNDSRQLSCQIYDDSPLRHFRLNGLYLKPPALASAGGALRRPTSSTRRLHDGPMAYYALRCTKWVQFDSN
ncbi:hypothetical protein EVAR_69322_1 [Eumeta japonica]|uniref:Uncharacterized protein n=1 Tax=Eumeta variegata TaxID=151549 RepID=A0A4C2A2Z1_EUMVA|nr:hypothetical protein EVAR_69322_1 [Eumeta japonica]